MKFKHCSVDEAVSEVQKGRLLIITDANDREDEGDVFIPAEDIRAEHVNFMITQAKGLICVPLTRDRAEKLELPLMVAVDQNEENTKCNFTLSVDARDGIGSGISAFDRARTIQLLAAPETVTRDLVKPGHVFPLIAKSGGLRERQGHTEATIELCRLAGKKPVGVICEVIGQDGKMLRGEQLGRFAREQGCKIISIAQLMEFADEKER